MVVLLRAAVVRRLGKEDGRVLHEVAAAEFARARRVHLDDDSGNGEVLPAKKHTRKQSVRKTPGNQGSRWGLRVGTHGSETSVMWHSPGCSKPVSLRQASGSQRSREAKNICARTAADSSAREVRVGRRNEIGMRTHITSLVAAVHVAQVAVAVGAGVDMVHCDVLPDRRLRAVGQQAHRRESGEHRRVGCYAGPGPSGGRCLLGRAAPLALS